MKRVIAAALLSGKIGTDYQAKAGGTCPTCGTTATRIYKTMPWVGATRARYHRCAQCGKRFKTTEHSTQIPAKK